MKTTKFSIGRILVALLLVLTMAFSFVGCQDTETQDRIAALEQAKADLTAALNEVKTVADAAATKTALEEAKAALAALQTGSATKAELEAAIDKIEAAEAELELVATDAEVAAIKAGLEKAINDAKTALSAKDTELANAIAALQTSANGVAGQIDAKVNALKTELSAKITTLETKATNLQAAIDELDGKFDDLGDEIDDLGTALDTHKAAYETLKAAVEALQSKLDGLTDPNGEGLAEFVAGYKAATQLLYEVKENGDPGDFSFDNFYFLTSDEEVPEDNYDPATWKTWTKKVEKFKFELSRAVSVEEVKGIFADLKVAIDELPTLSEILANKFDTLGYIANDQATKDKIDFITSIYEQMAAPSAEETAKYNEVIGAYNQLLEAVDYVNTDFAGTVNALPAIVLLEDSEAAITGAMGMFDTFVSTCFSNEVYNAYYYEIPAEADAEAKAALAKDYAIALANADANNKYYDIAKAKADRYNALVALKTTPGFAPNDYTNFGVIDDPEVEGFLPLYNNTEIPGNYAAYQAWLKANALDVELQAGVSHNVKKILVWEKCEALENANAYVVAMNTIYTTMVKGADVDLLADVNALLAVETITLTNDAANADEYREAIDAVLAAIVAVENYNEELDGNFAAMFETVDLDKFVAVEDRIASLEEVKGLYAELLANINTDIPNGEVLYSHYVDIQKHLATSADYKEDYDLVEVHYAEVGATAVDELLATLVEKYNVLIADIKEVYIETKALLDQLDDPEHPLLLSQGNAVINLYDKLFDIVVTKGITDININLGEVDGETGTANLDTLYIGFAKVVTAYGKLATAAQTDAQAIYTNHLNAILAEGFKAGYLSNAAAIDAAIAAVDAWIAEHCANETGSKAEILAKVADIKVYEDKNDTYDFILAADYAKLLAANDTSDAAQAAAVADLAAIKAKLDAFKESNAISVAKITLLDASKISAIGTGLVAYYNTYYGETFTTATVAEGGSGSIEVLSVTLYYQVNGVAVVTDEARDYAAVKAVYGYKLDKAEDDAADIKALIDAIMVNDPAVAYEAIITDSAAIVDALNAFYDNYYNGEKVNALFDVADNEETEDNDETVVGDTYILDFHKLDAKADFYKFYYAAEDTILDADKKQELRAFITMTMDMIDAAATPADVASALETGKSTVTQFIISLA